MTNYEWQMTGVVAIVAAAIIVPIIRAIRRRIRGQHTSSICSCGCPGCPVASQCRDRNV